MTTSAFPEASAWKASFRRDYLDHEALTAQLRSWAAAHPSLCRLRSLGKSTEGRDVWLLAVGPEPERARPALWVDGNMHAMELAGSSVALAFAEDVLALHAGAPSSLDELPKATRAALADVLVYVAPRLSPDGAEAVLRTGRFVRSSPVDDRLDRLAPRWLPRDLDGDGLALTMRVRDDGGDFVESAAVPGLMVARTLDDDGPFFKLYPEGVIDGWDGQRVPPWGLFDDNRTDLNRNFPWSWAPEGDQLGAGAYATSSPEARAVVEFVSRAPHIMAWLNLHTFGGVYIRPSGHKPDNKMDREDLEVFRQLGAWVDEHTGYACVSGYEEFLYTPDTPLRGDASSYAYEQLGCVSAAVELWDLFARAGLPRPKRFVEAYQRQSRADMEAVARWDRDHNEGRALRPWRAVQHPQLGDVEVGGLDPRIGVWNPPPALLDEVCRKNARVFARVAALLPRVDVVVTRVPLGGNTSRLDVRVQNRGYLATHGLASAKKLALSEPLHVDVAAGEHVRVLDAARKSVGHLDGWGRGLSGGSPTWPYQLTTATDTARTVSFLVEGDGPAAVRVGSCRVGFIERVG